MSSWKHVLMITTLVSFVFVTPVAALVPAPRGAVGAQQTQAAAPSAPRAATDDEVRDYARREARAKELDRFEGGWTYVAVPVSVLVLGAILLIVLL